MIKKAARVLSEKLYRNHGTSETRIELKKKLDYFASENSTLVELIECLKIGPVRSIKIFNGKIIVSIQSTGTRYYWEKSDPRTAIACLAVTGEYEPLETQILKFFAKKSRTIFDIGANVGYYAVELSQSISSVSAIHAFEPVPNSFEQLKQNVELNEISSLVTCIPLAVSNTHGKIRLYKPKTSGSSASSARNLHPDEKVEKIDVSTIILDHYIQFAEINDFDLLKIDVEGAELMVIEGAINSIQKYRPVIFVELLRKWSAPFGYHPNKVLETLMPLGYRCYGVGTSMREIFEVTDSTLETNFLFVPPSKNLDLKELFVELGIQK